MQQLAYSSWTVRGDGPPSRRNSPLPAPSSPPLGNTVVRPLGTAFPLVNSDPPPGSGRRGSGCLPATVYISEIAGHLGPWAPARPSPLVTGRGLAGHLSGTRLGHPHRPQGFTDAPSNPSGHPIWFSRTMPPVHSFSRHWLLPSPRHPARYTHLPPGPTGSALRGDDSGPEGPLGLPSPGEPLSHRDAEAQRDEAAHLRLQLQAGRTTHRPDGAQAQTRPTALRPTRNSAVETHGSGRGMGLGPAPQDTELGAQPQDCAHARGH